MSVGKKQGFSIVQYHGNGTNSTQHIPHGLGKKPTAILLKNLDETVNFDMNLFGSYRAAINSAEANQGYFQTVGLEDTFTVPSNSDIHNKSNIKYIAYCT